MKRRTLFFPICALILVQAVLGQVPPGYRIVDVTINQRHEYFPRINNRGQVVFSSRIAGDVTSGEIFLYDHGQLIRITNDNVFDALADINDDGTIVWSSWMGPIGAKGIPTPEIMMYRNGVITRITDNALEDWSPTINNLDQVAWQRSYEVVACGGYLKDIFMFDGQREIQISMDALTETVENQGAEINDLSEIVWTRYDFCDPPAGVNFESKILMYSGGQVRELSNGHTAPLTPDLNNRGQVVWQSYDRLLGLTVIDFWEAGLSTVLTDGEIPVINDLGDVAFIRSGVARAGDIWLYRNAQFYHITENAIPSLVPDINDRGEVAWRSGPYPEADIRILQRFEHGDLNCDGRFDGADIDPFFLALGDPQTYRTLFPNCDATLADMNGDGLVTGADIDPFFTALGGG